METRVLCATKIEVSAIIFHAILWVKALQFIFLGLRRVEVRALPTDAGRSDTHDSGVSLHTLALGKLGSCSPLDRGKLRSVKEWPGRRKCCIFELVQNAPCADLLCWLAEHLCLHFPWHPSESCWNRPWAQGGFGLGRVWLLFLLHSSSQLDWQSSG